MKQTSGTLGRENTGARFVPTEIEKIVQLLCSTLRRNESCRRGALEPVLFSLASRARKRFDDQRSQQAAPTGK